MLRIIRVAGSSMAPRFMPDDYVMTASRAVRKNRLNQGDICVFKTKRYGTMIKRIASCDNNRRIAFFEGENPMSITTEEIGAVPYGQIAGVVIKHFPQK